MAQNKSFAVFFASVLCLICADVSVAQIGTQSSRRDRSETKEHSIEYAGLTRTYSLCLPSKLVENPPLIFVLHGGGGNAERMIRSTGFTSLAERDGVLVCYPNAIDGNWNDGRDVSFMRSQREEIDDVGFIRRLIDEIDREHSIDRTRVFATGASNGGIMSHRLAAEASDAIAGIAPVIGALAANLADDFEPEFPVSLLVIQGDADPLVPFDGGDVGTNLRRKRGKVIATEQMLEMYVRRSRIEGRPTVEQLADRVPRDNSTVEKKIYPAASDGTLLHYYVVKGGGHTWPGKRAFGLERLVGTTNRDIDATAIIWDFFKKCPPREQTQTP